MCLDIRSIVVGGLINIFLWIICNKDMALR